MTHTIGGPHRANMVRRTTIPLMVSAALLAAPARAVTQEPTAAIPFATGDTGGVYYRLGHVIAMHALRRGVLLTILSSSGSVENIELLDRGRAYYAIVQSDIAHRAAHGHRPFTQRVSGLTLIAPLHAEAVQVLARAHLHIFTPADLRGKAISFGPTGSGSEETGKAILGASGLSTSEVMVKGVGFTEFVKDFRAELIDAAVVTTAMPSPMVKLALSDDEVRLVPLESRVIDQLVADGSYLATSIPRSMYGQRYDVPTVEVQALLVASRTASPATTSVLLRVLREDRKTIEHEAGVQLLPLAVLAGTTGSFPVDSLARTFTRAGVLPRMEFVVAALVLVGLAAITWYRGWWSHRNGLRHHSGLLLPLGLMGMAWIAGSAGLYVFEGGVNEYFDSFPLSLWSVLVYVSGGFQARTPLTSGGQVVAVLIVVFGVGLVAWFTGELANSFVKREMPRIVEYLALALGKRKMPTEPSDHVVLINWDNRTADMIRQIRSGEGSHRQFIVVMCECDPEMPDEEAFKDVVIVRGDPHATNKLAEAHVCQARSVTILASWPVLDPSDRRRVVEAEVADTKTIMMIMAIRALCVSPDSSPVPITAELRSSRNVASAGRAGLGGSLEVVCVEQFGTAVFTQCALTPGLAGIYEDLLTFDGRGRTNEIYRTKVPAGFAGTTFSDLLDHFRQRRLHGQERIIPIGVRKGVTTHLNPADAGPEINPGDDLFVISAGAPPTER